MRANAYQERSNDLIELSAMVIESETLSSALAKLDFRVQLCSPENFATDKLTGPEIVVVKEYLLAQLFRLQNLDQQYHFGLLEDRYHQYAVIGTLKYYLPIWKHFGISQRSLAESILTTYDGIIPDRCEASAGQKLGISN